MTTVIFDSHTFVKRLRATGFTEEQAEVIVDASRDALANLVTKDDLSALAVLGSDPNTATANRIIL